MFSNTWAVKIRGGPVVLERLARKHGFVNETQVGGEHLFTVNCWHGSEILKLNFTVYVDFGV